jgi:hypothetical protein
MAIFNSYVKLPEGNFKNARLRELSKSLRSAFLLKALASRHRVAVSCAGLPPYDTVK